MIKIIKNREKTVKKPKNYQNYTQSYSNVFLIPNPYPNCMIRGGLLVLYSVSCEFIIKKRQKLPKLPKIQFFGLIGGFFFTD